MVAVEAALSGLLQYAALINFVSAFAFYLGLVNIGTPTFNSIHIYFGNARILGRIIQPILFHLIKINSIDFFDMFIS